MTKVKCYVSVQVTYLLDRMLYDSLNNSTTFMNSMVYPGDLLSLVQEDSIVQDMKLLGSRFCPPTPWKIKK